MKQLFFTIILSNMLFFALGQEFSFTLYFEDALGNKDQVIIGHDPEATMEIDPEFGEENIIDEPFDEVFEVRAGTILFDWYRPYGFLTKKQILPKWCEPTMTNRYFQEIYISCKNFPLTISWEAEFEDECVEYTFLTDREPGGWWCGGGRGEQGPFLLKDSNYVVIPCLNDDQEKIEHNASMLNWLHFSICTRKNFEMMNGTKKVETNDSFRVLLTESGVLQTEPADQVRSIALIDTSGNVCAQSAGPDLNITPFPAGVYMVRIITGYGTVPVFKKIIKP